MILRIEKFEDSFFGKSQLSKETMEAIHSFEKMDLSSAKEDPFFQELDKAQLWAAKK